MDWTAIAKTSLDVVYHTGLSRATRPLFGGLGAIFMLHHVRPAAGVDGFAPNRALEVTPEFLDAVISHVRASGYDLLPLDAAVARIKSGAKPARRFAVFTLDDGYRNNLTHALPVFRRHNCPFTIYIAPTIADGTCELWWQGLEAAIAGAERVDTEIAGLKVSRDCRITAEKCAVFDALYWPLRGMDNLAQRSWIRAFCTSHGVDLLAMCRGEAMDWKELRQIAADPLCGIGAHTVNHYALSRLTPEEVLAEAVESRNRVEQELGRKVRHFAYPYGDETTAGPREFALLAKAGYSSAVTTRKGLVFPEHANHLTALPRVSLNGHFQRLSQTDALLSGGMFALWNRFRKVNAG